MNPVSRSNRIRMKLLVGILLLLAILGVALLPKLKQSWEEAQQINTATDRLEARAQEHLRLQGLEKELPQALAAVEKSPQDVDARLHYASLLGQTHQYKEAAQQLILASQLAPQRAEPHIALSEVYESGTLLDLSVAEARVAAKLEPDNARALSRLGYAYIGMDWNQAAARHLKAAVARFPKDATLHAVYAQTLYQMTSYREALDQIKAALEIAPDNGARLGPMASILLKLNRLPEAKETIEKAIAYDPTNSDYHLIKAEIERAMNDLAGAESEARLVLKYHPGDVEALYQLGLTRQRQGATDEALTAIQKVMEFDPNYKSVMPMMIRLLSEKKMSGTSVLRRQLDRQQQISDKATRWSLRVANNPEDEEAHYQYGLVRLERRNYPRAITELKEALLLRPDDTRPAGPLTKALRAMRRPEEAQAVAMTFHLPASNNSSPQ